MSKIAKKISTLINEYNSLSSAQYSTSRQLEIKKELGKILLNNARNRELAQSFGSIAAEVGVCISPDDFPNATILDVLCLGGNLPGVKAAISAGKKLEHSSFPIYYAALSGAGSLDLLRFLSEIDGFDPNAYRFQSSHIPPDYRDDVAPIIGAIRSKNHKAIKWLCQKGADINRPLNALSLREAVKTEDEATLRAVVEAGVNLEFLRYSWFYEDFISSKALMKLLKILCPLSIGCDEEAIAMKEAMVLYEGEIPRKTVREVWDALDDGQQELFLVDVIHSKKWRLLNKILAFPEVQLTDTHLSGVTWWPGVGLVTVFAASGNVPLVMLLRAMNTAWDAYKEDFWMYSSSYEEEDDIPFPSEDDFFATKEIVAEIYLSVQKS